MGTVAGAGPHKYGYLRAQVRVGLLCFFELQTALVVRGMTCCNKLQLLLFNYYLLLLTIR